MIESIVGLFNALWQHKKLFAYLLVVLFYLGSCFASYIHGRTAEKNAYYKQTSSQQEGQQKNNENAANKAIKQETDISKKVTQLDSSKEQVKQKINELSKQDPCTTSKLSDDERVYINGLIDQANK